MSKITDVADYENLYFVSEDGRVFSHKTKKELKSSLDRRGYARVWLYKDNLRKEKSIHRIVATAFVEGNRCLTVNHKDGDKKNNHYSNLEWVSNADNMRHSFSQGLRSIENMGRKRGKSFAIKEDVLVEAFKEINSGTSVRKTAKKYNVERTTLQYQYNMNRSGIA